MIPKLPAGSRTPRPGISWFNAVADAVNAHQSRKTSVAPGQSFTHHPQALRVTVKNSTASDIGSFRPLDIDGITLPDNPEIVLNGVAGAGGLFVITQEPIAAGKVGSAVIQGLTKAYATGSTAGQASSDGGALAFGSGRAQVIYDSDDAVTTERLVIVNLDTGTHAFAVGEVTHSPTSGTKTGFALVRVDHCSDGNFVGESVWVADYMGQLLADEDAAARVGRKVAMFLASAPLSIHTVNDSATSTTVGTGWVLIHANCPELV